MYNYLRTINKKKIKSIALLLLAEQILWTQKSSELRYQEKYNTMKTEGGRQYLLKIEQKISYFLFW